MSKNHVNQQAFLDTSSIVYSDLSYLLAAASPGVPHSEADAMLHGTGSFKEVPTEFHRAAATGNELYWLQNRNHKNIQEQCN